MAVPVLSENFAKEISHIEKPVVIEFFALWCPKCAMMNPIYEKIARTLRNEIVFYKVDVDHAMRQVAELGIEIYPTFIVYHKGKILGYTAGVLSESVLKARILELTK